MNIFQIGELAGHLSENYREATSDKMAWRAIRAIRNLFAHNYSQMNIKIVWATAVEIIPQLKAFCAEEIEKAELLQIDSAEYSDNGDDDLKL